MPQHIAYDGGDGEEDMLGWLDAFLEAIADAVAAIAKGSEA